MSAGSRWAIGIFCGIWVVLISAIPVIFPGGSVNPVGIIVVDTVLIIIIASCIQWRGQRLFGRIFAGFIFCVCVAYLVTELRTPQPDFGKYRRSQANLVNACIAFVIFGLPAGYLAVTGNFPAWTFLYGPQDNVQIDEDYEDEGEEEWDSDQ